MAEQVVVRGTGRLEVQPDAARLRIDARARANDSSAAHTQAAIIAAAVDALLERHTEAIRRRSTSGLLVTPVHEWTDKGRQFAGWDAVRSSTVEVVDAAAIGPLFAGLADADAVTGDLEWVVDDDNAAHGEARRAAAKDALDRAAAYTGALGVQLGPVIDIREPATKGQHDGDHPRAMALAARGGMESNAMAVEAPQLHVSAEVDVTFGFVA